MSSRVPSSNSGSIGFYGLLTVLFIGLKLTNYIAWSWWWVLGPLWIPTAIVIFILIVILIIAGVDTLLDR